MRLRQLSAALVASALVASPARAQVPPSPGGRLFGTDEAPPPGAQPPRQRVVMRLSYVRAPGAEACPDEQGFRDAVGAHVRRWDPFAPNGPAPLLVTVSRRGTGYEGTADLRDVTGAPLLQRSFPPTASCLDLLGDLARAIALKIDPPAPPAPSVTIGEPAPAPAPGTPPPDALPPPPPSPTSPAFRIGAAAWVDLATAPRPAFGVSLDLGVRVAWFSISAEGRLDPPAGSTVKSGVDVGTTRTLGALVPCGHAGWFAGCLVGELGSIRGTIGVPKVTPDHQSGLFAAGGVRLAAEIPVVRHLLVRVAADLLGARPVVFRLKGQEQWRSAVFTGGLGAGVIASF